MEDRKFVWYQYGNEAPQWVQWSKSFEPPRTAGALVRDYGGGTMIATGRDRSGPYVDVLRAQVFSTESQWCEASEDPENRIAYSHLHEPTFDNLNDLKGPSVSELNNIDFYNDDGPSDLDMGLGRAA
jgi:hypothetical protein